MTRRNSTVLLGGRALLLFLLLPAPLPPAGALRPSPSYTSVTADFQINEDRTVSVEENRILNLPGFYSSLTVEYIIPSENLQDLLAWCRPGEVSWESKPAEGGTRILLRFSFPTPFRGELRYGLSYRASGWVGGEGPKYEAILGGVRMNAGSYPYESYRITIRGPPGSRLFWYEPRGALPSPDLSSVTYSTSVGAPGSFDGLLATFYITPAYYRLILTETLRNTGKGSCDLVINLLLWSEGRGRFASLLSSDPPVGSLYADEENNWYASFRIKLAPGETRQVRVELLWRAELNDPRISPLNSGTLEELPPGMEEYLKEKKWWEVEELRSLSLQLAGGERNLYLLCQKLLQWMEKSITYTSTQERQGALLTLQRGAGDCDCMSDLFIALLRALGVSSRLSFGWTAGKDVGNHAWVEVYLPSWGWQPVDPTWSRGSEKYLFRMDSLHLPRGSRGLTSSDSYLSRAYYGDYPEIEPEEVSLSCLTEEEALQEFLLSARLTLELAENSKAEDPRLALARRSLEEAEAGGGIEEALRSLSYSLEILKEHGGPLELPRRIPLPILILLVVSGVGLLLALALGLKKKF